MSKSSLRLPAFLFFVLSFWQYSLSQILTNSEFPIVSINTGNTSIPDEPKIPATMGIIDQGAGNLNNINDAFNHYDGNIAIETRGNSTQDFDKKTYSLELRTASDQDTSVALLGMGGEEDWILHAMVIDKTQLRIPMSFYLFQRMGHYASNWRYVELMLDGDYQGLYILTEKIKRDDDRVDIAKLDDDDIAGDSVTGGYILRIDWLDNPQGFSSNFNSQGGVSMFYQWYYPKASRIKPEQAAYIENYMDEFEAAVFAPSFTNNSGKRYTDYIDIVSFVDFLLINEFSKNADGYKLSSYLHKDKDSKGGKLTAGPIWDFDQTYGLSIVCSNDNPTGWTYLQNQPECEDLQSMPMWWQAMMSDTVFTSLVGCRWDSLRQGPLHEDTLTQWIDTHVGLINNAIGRNFTRWPNFIGNSVWLEPEPVPQSYAAEITYLKGWISNRLAWMDNQLAGTCGNTTSIAPHPLDKGFKVYPNPANKLLYVQGKQGYTLKLVQLNGQILSQTTMQSEASMLNVSTYPAGMYIVVLSGEGYVGTRKVIIQ